MSEMLKELAQAKEESKHIAKTGEGGNPDGQTDELPEGSSPLEARQASSEGEEETPEEASESEAPEGAKEEETLIRIGDREFKTQAEAIRYAEELERKTEAAELYNQGVRDALASSGRGEQPAEAEPEDNFEERFYANPKETLREVQSRARDEAIAAIKAEQNREVLWGRFLTDNPDIRRKDAERILAENGDTIGRMTDVDRAMKLLAQKTRAEYEEIRDLGKPRTELKNKPIQAVSPSGGSPRSVTPKKNDGPPLSFAEEMRRMKTQR
jgi:hypothetical protein